MRVKTYFGVPIPPMKRKPIGAGSTTIRFVITGRIPSKKNNQQAITVRRDAMSYIIQQEKEGKRPDARKAVKLCYSKMRGNDGYREFVERVKPILQKQASWWADRLKDKGLIFPIAKATMSLDLMFKDRYVTDTVNKQQTIQDILIEAGIIANDDYNTLNPIHSESACYYEELHDSIAFISLSFRL